MFGATRGSTPCRACRILGNESSKAFTVPTRHTRCASVRAPTQRNAICSKRLRFARVDDIPATR